MMKYNRLEIDELKFLIRKNTNSLETENSVPWLSNSSWMQLCCIESLPAFKGFKLSFLENLSNWKEYFDSVENFPQLPQPWDESLAPFQKLIVVKMLQPEKLIPYIVQLIEQELSSKFTSSPPFDISISYADSNCLIPLVFILSPGTDPMKSLIQFSQRMNFGNKFQSVSLGEGQEAVVTKLIKEAQVEGSWVCLQNCHLAPSWLIELEKICKNFDLSNTAHTFRLWLTSCSSELFPTYILHKGVKMVIEAPIHLQQNLLSNYLSDPIKDPEFFESCPGKDGPFTKLLYGISFFHAVIQERKTFGAIGWNIPYSFNESDFHVSITQLQMIINEYADVPYETLNYVIGECNYGGRVIDALDRKLLATLLSNYFNKAVVNNPNYLFYSGSEKTQIPVCSDYQEFLSTISDLPFIASPEMFGLHQNAGIGRDLESTGTFLKTLLLVQESGFREDTTDFYSNASLIAGKILDKLPKAFDFQKDKNNTSSSQDHSTDLFITQELMLFNTLRSTIQSTLSNLQNGVKGIFLMTSYLEDIARSLNNNQCPNIWFKYSYPSVRSLSDYMSDFAKRFEYLKEWRLKGEPPSIWLSCFFHLQGFFNICQHNHSRNHNIAADLLTFDQQVLEADSITEAPDIGVYGFGLYLEGARWDRNLKCLQEQHFKVAFDAMPIIWFKPIFCSDLNVDGRFLTPVYQTSERRGSISALGTSSNFVSMVLLDSKVPDHHWIMRGVALLCQLDS